MPKIFTNSKKNMNNTIKNSKIQKQTQQQQQQQTKQYLPSIKEVEEFNEKNLQDSIKQPSRPPPGLPPLTVSTNIDSDDDSNTSDSGINTTSDIQTDSDSDNSGTLKRGSMYSLKSIHSLPTWEATMKEYIPEMNDNNHLITVIATTVGQTYFKELLGDATMMFVSTLSSSLISIGAAITSMLCNTTTTMTKVMNTTSIVASLISFISTTAYLMKQRGINFDSEKIIQQTPVLVQNMLVTDNQSNSLAWLYPAITAVISLILGGLTLFDVCDIKSIIQRGAFLRSVDTITSIGKDITKYLLEDLCHLDISGDQAAFSEVETWAKRSSELASYPYLRYLSNSTLMCELHTAVEKTLPLLKQKYHNKNLSQTVRGAHHIILQNHTKLTEKLAAIRVILASVKRQETLGVLLAGEPSVGKSSLSNYIAKMVAQKLNYNPDIYNLNMSRKDGFYGPYGGQDFGIIDEFMSLRKEDPNLPQINQILSGDHFNFESAHLEGKVQPSALKCAFLTSNNICPNLVTTLDETAAKATWDRIIRVQVSDPLVQGRHGKNIHRRMDFSHLTFQLVMNTHELNACNLEYKEVTIDELLGLIVIQIVQRELSFIKQTPIIQATENEQEPHIKRVAFLNSINDANTANGGQDFNVIRIQGPLNTGKTRIANIIAKQISQAYISWPIIHVKDFDIKPTKRAIYIIDDLIEQTNKDYETYFKWINHGHTESFYILTTNFVYIKQKTLKEKCLSFFTNSTNEHYLVDTLGVSNGLARRIGLNGSIHLTDGSKALCLNGAITIDVPQKGTYYYNNVAVSQTELTDFVYRTFKTTIANIHKVRVVNDTYCGVDTTYDATVTCDNLESMNKAFSTLSNTMKSCAKKTNGTYVTFTNEIFALICKNFGNVKELIPPCTNNESVVDRAHCFATILNDIKPGVTCKIHFIDTNRTISLVDFTLYTGVSITDAFDIIHNPQTMTIHFIYNNQNHSITYEEYTNFVRCGKLTQAISILPAPLVSIIHNYVISNIGDTDPMFNYHNWYASYLSKINEMKTHGIIQFVKNNKVMSIIAGIGALLTTAGVLTLCVKMFRKDQEGTQSNALWQDDYGDNAISEHIIKFKKALINNPTEAALIREEAYQLGHREKWNTWEDEFRSNAKVTTDVLFNRAIKDADIQSLQRLLVIDPQGVEAALITIQANNLTMAEETHQRGSELEYLQKRLRKNCVKVVSHGIVYGIGITSRILITVSHIFDDLNSAVTVESEGKSYKARVLRLNRKRDLAFVIIEDKTFPQFSDIKSLLMTESEFKQVKTGWFIRPTTNPLLAMAKITFIEHTAMAKIDYTNPRFRLEAQFWMFSLVGVEDPARIFKSGDCGLPLVTSFNNEYKIVGIHNALNNAGYAWFTSIALDDMSEVKANSMLPIIRHPKGVNMVIDNKSHLSLQADFKTSVYEGVSPLKMYGFNKELQFYSNPMHKKKYSPIAEAIMPNLTLPSAIDLTNVIDTSKLTADRQGRINPLFSQAVKYAETLSTKDTFDLDCDEYVSEIIKTYYQFTYGEKGKLPLHEVVNGYGNLKGLEMSTSVGPKFKKFFGIQNKRPTKDCDVLFKNNNLTGKPFYIINKETAAGRELLNDYYQYCSAIDQGKPILIISKDNAKIELLPREKVHEGKVRLFNELDLSINMVLKTYFGSFLEKVIEKHTTSIYCIGTNPYLDATAHMLYFNSIDGEYANADFKALDKSTPKHLIQDFVHCTLGDEFSDLQKEALADTLIYRLHTLDGHCYFIDCGNASGSYVTTLMNCHTVLKVSLYTFCRRWKEEFGHFPTYKEIFKNVIIRIMGDDAIRKFSNVVSITTEDLVTDAAMYGLTQTPAKTEGLVSFCSRTYNMIAPNIYLPKLKKESITSALFWFNSFAPEQVAANVFTAMLEAALHEEEFYNDMKKAAILVCREYNVDFDFIPYKTCQTTFIEYIRGGVNSPVFKEQGNFESQFKNQDTSNSYPIFQKMADSWLHEYVTKRGMQTTYNYECEGLQNNLQWNCLVSVQVDDIKTISARGTGTTQRHAKRNACNTIKSEVTTNAIDKGQLYVDDVLVKCDTQPIIDCLHNMNIDTNKRIHYVRLVENVTSNSMGMEPSTINQAATGNQMANLPSSTNPQPTAIAPAMTSPGEDIMANLQFAEQQTLNPVGAPNMLSVGGITFDAKHLIYEQFMDSDIEYEVTDDLPSGGIIAQIPYGVNHPFVNPYIKAYSAMHERYTGAISYRFTVIGNPLFSGAIGISWQPTRITTSTISISESQKYAYSAKGVTMPWNQIHTLHDARRDSFFRLTNEAMDNNRPHLVVYLLMSLQNPLKEGVVTRVRIASKLNNAGEANPFVFSLPTIRTITPVVAANTLVPTAFNDVFSHTINNKVYMYTDGTGVNRQEYNENTLYPPYNPAMVAMSSNRRTTERFTNTVSTGTFELYGPNETVANTYTDFNTDWPSAIAEIARNGSTVVKALTTIASQTTMDSKSFGTLCSAARINGMGIKSFGKATQKQWEGLYTIGGWDSPNLARAEAPVKIQAILYNKTPYTLSKGLNGDNTITRMVLGYIKVITNRGYAIFYYLAIGGNVKVTNNELFGGAGAASGRLDSEVNIPNFPYLNIDEQLGYSGNFASLPLGYHVFRMSTMPPSAMLIAGYPGPTANEDSIIERWFANRAEGLPLTQCLQFRLVDAVSVRTIAVVRYLQENRMFVVNTNSTQAYKALPVLTKNINIQSVVTIERTNDFAFTDTTAWFSRMGASFFRSDIFQTNAIGFNSENLPLFNTQVEAVKSNASLLAGMAAGALGGVGDAIAKSQDRKHELMKQDKQFNQERDMQQNQFGQDSFMQGNMFEFQKGMQDNTHEFQHMMQNDRFGQEGEMLRNSSKETRKTNAEASQNRMTERGLGSRAHFLNESYA